MRLGSRIGPFTGRVDTQLLGDFARATGDPAAATGEGRPVPPAVLVTQLWEAQEAGRRELVPAGFQARASGGVHGEHDLVVHRPIEAGEPLSTWVEGVGARSVGPNSMVALRYRTFDAGDRLVAEQWWTTVWLGVGCRPSGGSAPHHPFPPDARDRPLGTWRIDVDEDMARRYAQLSGDWSAHHFEAAAARRSGAERPFLHGLCALALCARGVVEVAGAGRPDALRRVAVRFARPVLLGEQLEVRLYDAGASGIAFEAATGGAMVITQGRAELR